jgi:hypothetical protein
MLVCCFHVTIKKYRTYPCRPCPKNRMFNTFQCNSRPSSWGSARWCSTGSTVKSLKQHDARGARCIEVIECSSIMKCNSVAQDGYCLTRFALHVDCCARRSLLYAPRPLANRVLHHRLVWTGHGKKRADIQAMPRNSE